MVKTIWNRKSNIEFRRMRSSASCGICSASCGICSASCGIYSISICLAEFRIMRRIPCYFSARCGKYVPILRISAEFRIQIPLDAEYWNKFSASCGEVSAAYLFDFRTMRKYCSNTPHENFRIKHAENGVSCGESRYGHCPEKLIFAYDKKTRGPMVL